MRRSRSLFALCFVALPAVAFAQPAPAPSPSVLPSPAPASSGASDPCVSLPALVSRPSVTTASCSIKPGDLMIESGYTNTTTSGAGAQSSISYPQSNLRVGAGRNLEFDLNPESYERASTTPKTAGGSDTSLGAKYELGYTNRLIYAVNALYTANSGTPAFSGNGDGVAVDLDAALTISPVFGAFSTVGFTAQSAGTVSAPARYHGFTPSLGFSASFPLGFAAYIEGFGQTSSGPEQSGRYGFDGGLQKDVGSRLQLDISLYEFPGYQNGAHQSSAGFGAAYLIGPR